MARPRKARTLENLPASAIYIPAGWTKGQIAPVEVAIEDFEIMRLTDGHGYSIEDAARRVGVSRSTAGRMLERVRRAIALGIERRAPLYLDASEDLVLEPPAKCDHTTSILPHETSLNYLAVACVDDRLDAPVESIFGRAPTFVLVPIQSDGPLTLIENPGSGVKRNAASFAVKALSAQGVTRVVAGRYGPDAITALANANIRPYIANGFKLGQAIEFFNHKDTDDNTDNHTTRAASS
jgi:predicted DNA-binding protein (UPF0251 family)/predicted Fe-Mo cluster-binding NifX family protein